MRASRPTACVRRLRQQATWPPSAALELPALNTPFTGDGGSLFVAVARGLGVLPRGGVPGVLPRGFALFLRRRPIGIVRQPLALVHRIVSYVAMFHWCVASVLLILRVFINGSDGVGLTPPFPAPPTTSPRVPSTSQHHRTGRWPSIRRSIARGRRCGAVRIHVGRIHSGLFRRRGEI